MVESEADKILYPILIPLKYFHRIDLYVKNGRYSSIKEFIIQAIVEKLLDEEIDDNINNDIDDV